MNIEDIQAIGKPLVLATAAEVDELSSRLWITFPSGYLEYVTRLGEGVLGGSFVRIYPPWRIEKELPNGVGASTSTGSGILACGVREPS